MRSEDIQAWLDEQCTTHVDRGIADHIVRVWKLLEELHGDQKAHHLTNGVIPGHPALRRLMGSLGELHVDAGLIEARVTERPSKRSGTSAAPASRRADALAGS